MEKQKVIIAMKGHPGSGKSTLAQSIASALRIPLLDKDDVRDCTSSLHHQPSLLNDLSYAVLWRLAAAQLRLGLSLVVDSPLSRRAHLYRLRHLASSHDARLVLVECRPGNRAEWRRRLERRAAAAGDGGSGWHKPATWEDLEKLLEGYGGCTDYDVGDVARIVVDTTTDHVELGDVVSNVVQFVVCQCCYGHACK